MADAEEQVAVDEQQEERVGGPTEVDERLAEVEDRLRWALADLDNLRKRFDREVARERATERSKAAAVWLPVVDDLERALEHAAATDDAFGEGIRAVLDRAVGILERLGFPRFDDLGNPFDPRRHDAVGTIESTLPAGRVAAVVRPGYGSDGAILRPASVMVSGGGATH